MTVGYSDVMNDIQEPVLDLSRPELAPIVGRYVGPVPIKNPVSMPGNALIVGADDASERMLKDSLQARGWHTSTCSGPSLSSRCPLLVGGACTLRHEADAAVVFVNTSHVPSTGVLPKLRCAADRSSPYVLVLDGRIDAAQEREGGVVIGSYRGPEAIADATEEACRR